MKKITFGELLRLYQANHTDKAADTGPLEQLEEWIVEYDSSKEEGRDVFNILFKPPDR